MTLIFLSYNFLTLVDSQIAWSSIDENVEIGLREKKE